MLAARCPAAAAAAKAPCASRRAAGPRPRAGRASAAAGKKVVGVGGVGVDYLASVAAFPRPDEKLRTERLEAQGGGNAANALTAAARLGLRPSLLSKIGDDGLGDGILAQLAADGVDAGHVIRAPGAPSPFTYIIVDRAGGTRTCIHTPGANLEPSELTPARVGELLSGAALAYFDGRLTEAALVVARAARAAGVPVLVEGERLRPGLDALLAEADVVVTSAHFPGDWTGEAALGDALLATALRLPRARLLVTTLGKRGAVALERAAAPAAGAPAAPLEAVLAQLSSQLEAAAASSSGAASGGPPDCVASNGVAIRAGPVAAAPAAQALTFSAGRDARATAAAAAASAGRAAALNAEDGRGDSYAMAGGASGAGETSITARVTMVAAAALGAPDAVVDTTGAGDAFIGSLVFGLASGLPTAATLRLAAVVAACKCTALGARPGLPRAAQIAPALLAGR